MARRREMPAEEPAERLTRRDAARQIAPEDWPADDWTPGLTPDSYPGWLGEQRWVRAVLNAYKRLRGGE